MTEIRFEGRVAIVTGAGGGLGRSHALLLASRGARVVVNDLGGAVDGSGGGSRAADAVVDAIREAGGEAVANHDGVDTTEGAEAMVETALDSFGRVDIVINNAGILRDVSFAKMSVSDWDDVIRVHLTGSMNVTRAAWPHLRAGAYGRVVNTTSAAGLYGNFGQANYAAAKLGLVGLTKTLAQEGAKYDIKVNAIAPVAKSRMTDGILPPEVLDKLSPEMVSPLVAYLASEGCEASGQVFAVGGGYISRVEILEGVGTTFDGAISPEDVASRWDAIGELRGARPFANALAAASAVLGDKARPKVP